MEQISVKIKLVVFGVIANELAVFVTHGVLPSETIAKNMPLENQVEILFFNTTGMKLGNHYVEQLYTITNEQNEITIVYYVLVAIGKNVPEFLSLSRVRSVGQDKEIVAYAVQRLQWKIEYTNVVYSLLPKEFTLSELQQTYEAILGQMLDKRNFRKKILSLRFLEPTEKRRAGVSRPAQMYTFKEKSPAMVKIFS